MTAGQAAVRSVNRLHQDEFPSYEQTIAKATSLEDHLLWQLSFSGLSERNKAIGRLLIGNLDDDGYLRMSLSEMVAGTDFTEAEAESVLTRHPDV